MKTTLTMILTISMIIFFIIVIPLTLLDAFGSIALLPTSTPTPTPIPVTNMSYNNTAYRTPTLSEIETYIATKEANENLIEEYSEHVKSDDSTMCHLVYALNGSKSNNPALVKAVLGKRKRQASNP